MTNKKLILVGLLSITLLVGCNKDEDKEKLGKGQNYSEDKIVIADEDDEYLSVLPDKIGTVDGEDVFFSPRDKLKLANELGILNEGKERAYGMCQGMGMTEMEVDSYYDSRFSHKKEFYCRKAISDRLLFNYARENDLLNDELKDKATYDEGETRIGVDLAKSHIYSTVDVTSGALDKYIDSKRGEYLKKRLLYVERYERDGEEAYETEQYSYFPMDETLNNYLSTSKNLVSADNEIRQTIGLKEGEKSEPLYLDGEFEYSIVQVKEIVDDPHTIRDEIKDIMKVEYYNKKMDELWSNATIESPYIQQEEEEETIEKKIQEENKQQNINKNENKQESIPQEQNKQDNLQEKERKNMDNRRYQNYDEKRHGGHGWDKHKNSGHGHNRR